MRKIKRPLCGIGVAFMLIAAACGQKPGVYKLGAPAGAAGGAVAVNPEGQPIDAAGNPLVDAEGNPLAGGGSTTTTNGGTTGTGPGAEGDGGGDDGGGGGTTDGGAPTGGDSTGVEDDVIRIGMHAPITGAAPVPAPSFEKGQDLYWEWLESQNRSVNGRRVEVFGHNDEFNPSVAVAECKEMVQQERVFMIVGIAGADQIQACARYAATVGVPYISAGVTEQVVDQLPNYFAVWMSYAQQGPLLVDFMVTKLGAKDEKNAMVRFNTPGFEDGHDAWVAAMSRAGAPVTYDRAVSKTAGTTDAQTVATELCQRDIDNAYILTSPTFFIQLANAAISQCRIQYTGVGLTMTIDTVASAACRNNNSIHGARFLSPFPAYVDSNRFDPNFRRAGGTDDIMFGLWGISKHLEALLKLPGRNLTRERLMYFAERSPKISTGVLPNIDFSPTDHFGGSEMHLSRADCSRNIWVTEQAFVGDF